MMVWYDSFSKPFLKFSLSVKECLPPFLDDPLVKHTAAWTCGSTITFSCPPCFQLVGATTAHCTTEPDWQFDGEKPQCVPVCCPPIPEVRSGDPTYDVVTMSYNYTHVGDEEQQEVCGGNHVCQKVDVACEQCYEYNSGEDSFQTAPRRECQKPGTWTNQEEVCSRKSCPARVPETSKHIKYTDPAMESRVLCGNEVEFECKACYENLDGAMQHTCLPSKQWSDLIPTCSLKECGDLPFVNTHCTFPGEHMTCGSTRQLECEDCYYTDKCKEGNSQHTALRCNIEKEWEWKVEKPVVKIKTCDAPPVFEHTTSVTDGGDYNCGRLVRYECEECFELEDPGDCNCAELECKGSRSSDCTKGSWQGKIPKCLPKTCEALEVPEHAHVVVSTTSCLQFTQFECDKGYELVSGDLIRTCNTTKQWSGSPPVCHIRNCTQLEAPENGYISTMDHHYGTVVVFSCESCYRFPDSMTNANVLLKESVYPRYHILACEEHGNWNGSEPVCQRKYCGKPDVPGNAEITSMDFYCGDKIGFTCDEGTVTYFQSLTFCISGILISHLSLSYNSQ